MQGMFLAQGSLIQHLIFTAVIIYIFRKMEPPLYTDDVPENLNLTIYTDLCEDEDCESIRVSLPTVAT